MIKKASLVFLLSLVASPHFAEQSTFNHVYAQTDDPMVKIKQLVQEADESKAKGASRRMKRKRTARLEIYFKALRTYSEALRKIEEYQIEDQGLIDQISQQMDAILSDRYVTRSLEKSKKALMKALKAKNYDEVTQLAQNLVDLDQRNEQLKYLLSVVMSESDEE